VSPASHPCPWWRICREPKLLDFSLPALASAVRCSSKAARAYRPLEGGSGSLDICPDCPRGDESLIRARNELTKRGEQGSFKGLLLEIAASSTTPRSPPSEGWPSRQPTTVPSDVRLRCSCSSQTRKYSIEAFLPPPSQDMATPNKRAPSSRPSSLVTASYDADAKDNGAPEVESPSLSTPSARARFEFEAGKSNDGTKILMLEWEDDASTQVIRGSWTVSWEGKSHTLPAEERNDENSQFKQAQTHRLFFLLPPGVSIPTTITLTLRPEDASKGDVVWKTNPLPAIFPPGLYEPAAGGNTSRRPSKGVLHTLWAKKRLQTLQSEIDRELKDFPEGIGLEMAMKEKDWIETTFNIPPLDTNNSSHRLSLKNIDSVPLSPSSPLSPGGSRLAEKLKGLKLQTGEGELKRRDSSQTSTAGASRGPLSPDDEDIAVPSFSAFRGANPDVLAAKPAQRPSTNATAKRITPPVAPRQQGFGGVDSIAGLMAAGTGTGFSSTTRPDETEDEGELFAMPLSPRSPEMTKSPFSFAQTDTGKYLKSEGKVA
jgi:hypothetical protein